MATKKSIIITVILGMLSAAIFFSLYLDYAPQASVDLKYSRQEVIALAKKYLAELGYNTSRLTSDANFRFDSGGAFYLDHSIGLKQANRIFRSDSLLLHSWDIYFYDKKLAPSRMTDQFNVTVSPTGKVFGFRHRLTDSTTSASVSQMEARLLAEKFLQEQGHKINRLELQKSSVNELSARNDYTFHWTSKDSMFNMLPQIWVDIHGNKIGRYQFNLQEPEAFRQNFSSSQTTVTYIVVASSIATFVLLIFIITVFLKKYHDGEVGVKTGIYIFAVLFGIILLELSLRFTTIGYGTGIGDVNRFNVRVLVFILTAFIVQAFLAAMVFAGWSVGESSARRGWSDKLKAIDGFIFKKPFTFEFANSIFRGYSFGFIILAIITSLVAVIDLRSNIGMFFLGFSGIPESFFPSLSVILLALRISLLNEIVFRFFFIAWLREKTKKTWHGIIISSFLWMLIAFNLWDSPFGFTNFTFLFPAYFGLSIIFGLIVVKYDLLTSIVTNFIILLFGYAAPILISSSPIYQTQEWFLYFFLAIPLIAAAIAIFKKQNFSFSVELTPTHIKRISERERMAKELEIARNVQMSLLPKQTPLAEGYDIAGICIPALEVGGDYYDFFSLGNNCLGIAIGDVSGKGVPAAIYMTLTKGILQSHASESLSPKDVLNKLNRQMYQNIERNSFVSLFYAVLDMKKNKICFSRAGHNPAILVQQSTNKSTTIQPNGLAVGLESGTQFNSFLEEHELPLQSGDIMVFYTDGFTEASNENGDEFGEEKLEKIISENKNTSANGLIQTVVRSVKGFVGNHPQHDDMTMVVVRAL